MGASVEEGASILRGRASGKDRSSEKQTMAASVSVTDIQTYKSKIWI